MMLWERLETRILCATGRTDSLINTGWKFFKGDVANAASATFSDASWGSVNVPHTWNNLDGQDGAATKYYQGTSWYRRKLAVDATLAGRRFFLKFDGASLSADVHVNGKFVGKHVGGFAAFAFDVTPYLKVGSSSNVLAVKVNNMGNADLMPRSGDFTMFGGIYRDVHFITTPGVHIHVVDHASPGVFLKQTNVSAASANLAITTQLRNDTTASKTASITATIYNAAGGVVQTLSSSKSLAGSSTSNVVLSTKITNPRLWNGRIDPYMYRVRVRVTDSTGAYDEVNQPLGFRFFKITPNDGFLLNGKPYELFGVNLHQDRLNKGWAISPTDRNKDLDLVKEIGARMARLAHYQHAQQTYDRLDKDGILAWAEIPLINDVGTGANFGNNAKQQLRELIRQNYNHPSIIVWGIFNELNETTANNALAAQLDDLVHVEDPTRLSVAATDAADNALINTHTDVIAFNKYYGWYYGLLSDFGRWADAIHAKYPTRAIGIGEYGAGGSVKQHEVPPKRPRASGLFHPEEYQNLFHESYWQQLKPRKYLWSKLIWNMFDFAVDSRNEGDTPGRNDKGLVTYDRAIKKDAFFLYKANWSTSPVVYITSRRFVNRPAGATEVKVYGNLDSVTLKINGKSYGAKTSADRIYKWSVSLAGGTNTIEVSGLRGGVTYVDRVVWQVSSSTATATRTTSSAWSNTLVTARAMDLLDDDDALTSAA